MAISNVSHRMAGSVLILIAMWLSAAPGLAQDQRPQPVPQQPGVQPDGMPGPGMGGMPDTHREGLGTMSGWHQGGATSAQRREYVRQHGIPKEYQGRLNPLPASPRNLKQGAQLFRRHCAGCHGPKGYGDGEMGKLLTPPPANLAALMQSGKMTADDYLYWTIAGNGANLGTAMPAFDGALQEEDIWSIILHLRRLR